MEDSSSNTDEYRIPLTNGSTEELGIFLAIESEDDDECQIVVRFRDQEITAEARDFFGALCEIRLQLEKEGLTPICYGAGLNVYPSGMSRGMGGGRKAYKLELGKPARTKDLVEIFAVSPDINPASVAEQHAFWTKWLETPKA